MNNIFKDLDFRFAYIDGILVFSRSPRNKTNTFAPSTTKLRHSSEPVQVRGGSHPITWTDTLTTALNECKASLSQAALLGHPDPSAPLALVTDASNTAVGAVHQQRVQDAWQPHAFSRKPSTAEIVPTSGSSWKSTKQCGTSGTCWNLIISPS
jgi:hypothetical protein